MTKRPGKAARSPATILVVDPDDSLRKATRGLLESLGYRVLDASYAAGAEQIAKLYVGPIHVLLVEAEASGLNGQALADHLRSLHPELRVLFTCGRTQKELVKQGQLAARLPFIRKPFKGGQLGRAVRSVLGTSR